jgi:hypothetical protein
MWIETILWGREAKSCGSGCAAVAEASTTINYPLAGPGLFERRLENDNEGSPQMLLIISSYGRSASAVIGKIGRGGG